LAFSALFSTARTPWIISLSGGFSMAWRSVVPGLVLMSLIELILKFCQSLPSISKTLEKI
jgi:hypothetical protein